MTQKEIEQFAESIVNLSELDCRIAVKKLSEEEITKVLSYQIKLIKEIQEKRKQY